MKGEQGDAPLMVNELGLMKGERNKGESNKGELRVNHPYEGWIKKKP